MTVTIRRYHPADAPALAELFFRSVREVALGDYSQAQVEAWAPEISDPARYDERANDGRLLLVAVNASDEPIAYGDLEADGHIDHLYCRPDYVGHGVASALCDRLEAAARERGVLRLYVEASEMAKRFFEHKGYAVETRRNFDVRGVQLHNYAMFKNLR